ncbi:MAG: hypothetical protein KME47_25655 [Nodosilinea sp. WJT8-NPBG4]|nr:hypothetical protein [Nodosilinea sp. WJT8-NPBG4]
MEDARKQVLTNSTSARRRGRPPKRQEPKQKLTLSLTPTTRDDLQRIADRAGSSISEALESWVTNMMELYRPLKPLGRSSRRKGHKAMRGQAINYTEQKVKVTLSVTSQTKQGLLRLAEEAHDPGMGVSMADIVERWVTSYARDVLDAMDGY